MASLQVATPAAAGRKALGTPTAEGARSVVRPVKLFIGGLTRNTTTKQLRDHFAQYGRILDCVAMRQPDGRPRGFGYVTLDSPAAAERCLAEPQIVDGRVVDMKRAVPGSACGTPVGYAADPACFGTSPSSLGGGGGAKGHAAAASPFFPPGAWDMASYFGAAAFPGSPHSPSAAAWAAWAAANSPKAGVEMLDCLDVLRRGAVPPSPAGLVETPSSQFRQANNADVCESLGLLTGGHRPSRGWSGEFRGHGAASPDATPTAGGLSASAPEFVPRTTTAAAARGRRTSIDEDTPQKVELPSNPGQRRRSVLGDVTNLVSGSGYAGLSPVKAPLPSAIKGDSIRSSLNLENVTSPSIEQADAAAATAARLRNGRPAPTPLAVFEDGADDEKHSDSSGESSGAENREAAAAGAAQPRPESKTPRSAFPCGLPPGLSPPRHLQADRDLPVASTPASTAALTLPGILSTVPSSSPVASVATTAAPRTWTPTSAATVGKSVSTQTATVECAPTGDFGAADDGAAREEGTDGRRGRSASDDSCASSFSREELLRLRAPALKEEVVSKEAAAGAGPELAEAAAKVAES